MARKSPHLMTPRARILLLALAAWLVSLPLVLRVVDWRRERFRAIALHHRALIRGLIPQTPMDPYVYENSVKHLNARAPTPAELRESERHTPLYIKYARATIHPWLPVWPDPPEPR
ncbi:hypothetical protein EP7_002494 [Isosphaeraceae bacterium EP7]